MNPLLLLIDLQKDYLAQKEIEPSPQSIVAHAKLALDLFRRLGFGVAHVWTTVDRAPDNRMRHWKQSGRWICERGQPGHDTPEPLKPTETEAVFDKCAFSAFHDTQLGAHISANGFDLLVVCGLHLHACIRQSVIDAYQIGLNVVIVEDAVGSNDVLHAAITRRYLEDRGITFRPIAGIPSIVGSDADAQTTASFLPRH